jgi:bifunctional non-homologous end joining protein LigD
VARKPRATNASQLGPLQRTGAPRRNTSPRPGFIAPCEPKLRRTPPTGDRWLSEIKHDGYRVQAHLEAGRPKLFTRRGYDWTPRFAARASALADLPANNIVLDGEVIVQGETGVADFDALQADLASGRSERMVYFAFDLLYLDGFDLRNAPLIERKRILAALLEEAKSDCFHLAQHLEVAPALVFEQACAMGLEGIVCKLRDAPYRSGDRASWLKIKCVKRGVFPIVGFIPAPGAIAALHLARFEEKALAYAGGFTQKSARELREVLDELVTDRPPVGGSPLRPKSTWVRPELSAVVDYTAITREGLLRHASLKGLQQSRGKRTR